MQYKIKTLRSTVKYGFNEWRMDRVGQKDLHFSPHECNCTYILCCDRLRITKVHNNVHCCQAFLSCLSLMRIENSQILHKI